MGLLEEFPELKHRITVGAYHRMGEAGILSPEARVELIEGEIIDRAPIGKFHASVVDRLASRLFACGGTYADISATEQPGAMAIAMLPGVEIDLSGTW